MRTNDKCPLKDQGALLLLTSSLIFLTSQIRMAFTLVVMNSCGLCGLHSQLIKGWGIAVLNLLPLMLKRLSLGSLFVRLIHESDD